MKCRECNNTLKQITKGWAEVRYNINGVSWYRGAVYTCDNCKATFEINEWQEADKDIEISIRRRDADTE